MSTRAVRAKRREEAEEWQTIPKELLAREPPASRESSESELFSHGPACGPSGQARRTTAYGPFSFTFEDRGDTYHDDTPSELTSDDREASIESHSILPFVST